MNKHFFFSFSLSASNRRETCEPKDSLLLMDLFFFRNGWRRSDIIPGENESGGTAGAIRRLRGTERAPRTGRSDGDGDGDGDGRTL